MDDDTLKGVMPKTTITNERSDPGEKCECQEKETAPLQRTRPQTKVSTASLSREQLIVKKSAMAN
jgi:hypothetical protein